MNTQPFFNREQDPDSGQLVDCRTTEELEAAIDEHTRSAKELRMLAALESDIVESSGLSVDATGKEALALGALSSLCARKRAFKEFTNSLN